MFLLSFVNQVQNKNYEATERVERDQTKGYRVKGKKRRSPLKKKKLLDLEHPPLELSRKKQKEKREATFFHP